MNIKRKTLKMPVRYLMNLVLVGLLFVGLSYVTGNMLSTYQNKVLLTVGINIILAVSLNVATGYLGQLPLGHAGFMAVGAYACALFTKSSGLPKGVAFAIGLVLAWVIAGLFGVLIGIPALRLTGDYLAILTLGFGEIIRITLNNIDDVLGFKLFYGSKGLKNIPKYSNFTNVFLCVVITCFLIHAMMKSRHGRAVLAIRDNEIAAESCGIQTTYYKVMAFAFSAAFAGLAGGLYACYIGVLNPSTFGFMKSIEILVMVVLGGMGSMLGSILSATVLTILPEATRSFESYRMVVYSLAEFNRYTNSPIANYKGEIYNMPFNMNTFSKMWGIRTPEEAKTIIEEQRKAVPGEPKNLEEQAIKLVGKDIYEKLVKGYTEKQWGRDCSELPSFIIKRLPVRFTYDNNYFNDLYQGIPIGGYNVLTERLFEKADVQTGVDFLEDKEKYLAMGETVIYTGAIDAFYDYALGKLEYRTVRFETEVLDTDNYQGVAVVNYTDRETPYTRVIEHKHFEFGTQKKTVISREYSTDWKEGMEPYYPVNDARNQELYQKYAALAEKEEKVIFGGRLGEYKYYDMDKVIEAALNQWEKMQR